MVKEGVIWFYRERAALPKRGNHLFTQLSPFLCKLVKDSSMFEGEQLFLYA